MFSVFSVVDMLEQFSPTSYLCYPRGAATAADGLSLGQCGESFLETAGIGSLYMGKASVSFSQKLPL